MSAKPETNEPDISSFGLHAIAEAVLRNFVPGSPDLHKIERTVFVVKLEQLLTVFHPDILYKVGLDVLNAARILEAMGNVVEADAVAVAVRKATKRVAAKSGRLHLFADEGETATRRFAKLSNGSALSNGSVEPRRESEETLPAPEKKPRRNLLAEKWGELSEERRTHLARLADELEARAQR